MNRKLTACIVILLTVMLLPLAASAQETTLTTTVPSGHRLHIDITGNGEVIVDDISCKQTGELLIQRGTTPQISVEAANDAVLKTAILNDKDITQELRNGAYIMPEMCFDANLSVTFEAATGTPQTGDSTPVAALCLAMVLSLTGVLCCFLLPRKREI